MSYIYSLYISLSKKSKPSTQKKSQNLTCKLPKIKHIKTYNGYLSFSFPKKKKKLMTVMEMNVLIELFHC